MNTLLAKRKANIGSYISYDVRKTSFNRLRLLITNLMLDIEKDFVSYSYEIKKEDWM